MPWWRFEWCRWYLVVRRYCRIWQQLVDRNDPLGEMGSIHGRIPFDCHGRVLSSAIGCVRAWTGDFLRECYRKFRRMAVTASADDVGITRCAAIVSAGGYRRASTIRRRREE